MRKQQETLRLRHELGLGTREISRSLCISHSTVIKYLKRAEAAGVSWPLPQETDIDQLLCPEPIPDNPKTSVIKSFRYEPGLNRTYEDLARHYGTVIIPARARAPQDKAKVEKGVQEAERRILAVLRHQKFFSLHELNQAIGKACAAMNRRPFQKRPGCRTELFEELDRPALKPLPAHPFEIAQWRKAKANIDYHVQVDWPCYSVPFRLSNQHVEVRQSARMVEIFHRGKRVALHPRSYKRGGSRRA